jgi:hypothetical protein
VCGWPLVEAKRREVLFECVVKVRRGQPSKEEVAAGPLAILFGVDGTLISTGGAGTRNWRWALENLHGIPADSGELSEAGMTDPAVARSTFRSVRGAFIVIVALTSGFPLAPFGWSGTPRPLP